MNDIVLMSVIYYTYQLLGNKYLITDLEFSYNLPLIFNFVKETCTFHTERSIP